MPNNLNWEFDCLTPRQQIERRMRIARLADALDDEEWATRVVDTNILLESVPEYYPCPDNSDEAEFEWFNRYVDPAEFGGITDDRQA